MQRETTNVEEQMIVRAIQEDATWEKLPKRLKLFFATAEDWNKKVKEHCIKKRLRWSDCLARMTCKESEFYEDLVTYLRKNQALFPYNLSDHICRIMRITPFRYYSDILFDVMKNERPYDSIPNFTAADALRLTGIGRNEFIDIMNKCRAKKIMWKINKAIVKDMLPPQPVDFPMEPWWTVGIIDLTPEELKKFADEDLHLIQRLMVDNPKNLVGEFSVDSVRALFRRGIVYLKVPVYPDDRFQVSTLEGFVSNKDQSYEDPTEELLYAVFVASSERATVAELAATLQADLGQLETAVSLACRLGWAKKLFDTESLLDEVHHSTVQDGKSTSDEDWAFGQTNNSSLAADLFQANPGSGEWTGVTRFVFLVDAVLTSYLMMGSLSPGLKRHSVTLYEAGKLGDSSVADMCEDLRKVEGTKMEGELQEFADHAFSLRHALDCMRSGGMNLDAHAGSWEAFESATGQSSSSNEQVAGSKQKRTSRSCKVDVIRCESLAGLPAATMQRVVKRDYNVVVSMVPLQSPPSVVSADGDGPVHFGPPSRAASSPWMKLLLYSVAQSGPVSIVLMRGQRLRVLPPYLAGCAKALVWAWDGIGVSGVGGKFEGSLVEGNILLHCLNAVMKQSAVLIQPFPRVCLTNAATGGPATKDVALPLNQSGPSIEDNHVVKNYEPHPTLIQATGELSLRTAGYVRLVKVHRLGLEHSTPHTSSDEGAWEWVPQSVEFGIPLFNTELCKNICEGIVRADLFDSVSLTRHGEAMQALRKKLISFIDDYQPSGSVCRLAYDGGKRGSGFQGQESAATGQWSPWSGFEGEMVLPPLTPTLSSSTNLQQPMRSRRRSEVASFVGELPKLLPLGTLFEAPSRSVEAGSLLSPTMKALGSNFVDEDESSDIPLPGVNLIFDGLFLTPLDIGACLQGRIPAALVTEAASASESYLRELPTSPP